MENNRKDKTGMYEKEPVSLTPHELVQRHIEHPNEAITDEDLANMNIAVEGGTRNSKIVIDDDNLLSSKDKTEADELADEIDKDNTGMAYTADL